MGSGQFALYHTYRISGEGERSLRRNARIQLTKTTGRCVTGIDEHLFIGVSGLRIHALEGISRNHHLASHLKIGRDIVTCQDQGHILNGAHVAGNVLARCAITAGRRQHQRALLVHDTDGNTVEFGLTAISDVGDPKALCHPSMEIAQIFSRKGVIQRQHRQSMLDRFKLRQGRRTHSLRGGVGRH